MITMREGANSIELGINVITANDKLQREVGWKFRLLTQKLQVNSSRILAQTLYIEARTSTSAGY
jgi:hypothetical protein